MLRYVGTIKDIGTFFKWTLANISYKFLYYSLNLRYVGVTLISLQRYLTICKWRSTWIKQISSLPRYVIFLVHWTVSLLLIIPILTLDSIRFGCVCKQMVAIDPDDFRVEYNFIVGV
ncbi:hypothetical protein ANCDUO_05866 [Ancylostoma duodenale]|uniref:G-protein coupled receptors family 1 profile domain-containing protein n=1 Tax=Ancylostoma duodenale TaxID=51022 RepID=A0A0C2GR90_9BILA|nr:hypothetical protein ANCDUO_05866 [Ancylostoma duodenale]